MTQEYQLRGLDQAENLPMLQSYLDEAVDDGWQLHTMLPKLMVFSRTKKTVTAAKTKAIKAATAPRNG